MILLKNYFINTTSEVDVISVIHEVNGAIRESKLPKGVVTVVVTGPGGALTVLEPLPEIIQQFKYALEIFPGEGLETLSRRKEPISIAPRIKAAMLGKSLQIPFDGGRLVLGPREEIVLIDFEKNARRREFCVQIMGESAAPAGPAQRQPMGGQKPLPKK